MQDPDSTQPQQPIDPTHIPSEWSSAPPPPVSSGGGPDFPTGPANPGGPDYPGAVDPINAGYPGGSSTPGGPAYPGASPGGPTYGAGPVAPGGPNYPGGPGGPAYPGGTGGYGGGFAPRPQISFDVIGEAWKLFQQQMGVWIPALLVVGLVVGVFTGITMALTGGLSGSATPSTPGSPASLNPMMGAAMGVQMIMGFVQQIVILIMQGGLFRMALKQIRGQTPAIGDLFSATDVVGPLILAALPHGRRHLFRAVAFSAWARSSYRAC